jgi:hypothetical protein
MPLTPAQWRRQRLAHQTALFVEYRSRVNAIAHARLDAMLEVPPRVPEDIPDDHRVYEVAGQLDPPKDKEVVREDITKQVAHLWVLAEPEKWPYSAEAMGLEVPSAKPD